MSDQTLSKPRRDERRWENDSKHGTRLRRQAGTDRFKSTVPDPQRPGRERVRHFRARNWTEARKEHAGRIVKVENGMEPKSDKTTLDDLAEQRWASFAGRVASGERAASTLEAEKILYRKHLSPALGRMRVKSIQAEHVSALLARLRRQGFKPSTIARVYAVLRLLLNLAVRRGLPVSPLERLDEGERPAGGGESRGRCLNDEECSRLIAHALPGTSDLIAFYAFTGVRQSEGLAVRWGDLDLSEGTVQIDKQLSRPKRNEPARLIPLKTARRNGGCKQREIELHPDLVKLLKRHKADAFARGLAGAGDYVFCTAVGGPLSQRNMARDLRTAGDRARLNPDGVDPLSTHDLRHTAISRWIAARLDPVTVARMAGDSLETILKTYAHEFDRAKNRDANRTKLAEGTSIVLG
jgi:integrase